MKDNLQLKEQILEALKTTEQKYKELFNNTNDGIFLHEIAADGRPGTFIEVNERACKMTGYAREELLTLSPSDIDETPPDTTRRIGQELLSKGQVIFETVMIAKNKDKIPIEISNHIFLLNGRKTVSSIVRDITERKRAEKEIAERGAMVQQIMDTASVGIALVDKRGIFTHANRRMTEMFGCTMEELIGSEYLNHVHLSEREASRRNMVALLESTIPSVDLERHYMRKDGTDFWGHLACKRFHDAHGNEVGLIGVITDITERRLIEEKLRQNEKKYRELVEAANSVILTWDTAGTITFLNNFAERFFGFSKEELLGRNVVGTIVPETESSGRDLAQLMREIQKDPDRFKDNENENITKDGRRVWLRWTNKAIMDEQGALAGILSIGSDITERKHAEEALRLTRFTVENVADAVYWMNSKAQFVDVNETACSMLGYTREEFLSLTVLDIDPDFTDERWLNAWETLKGRGKITLETRHRTKDGRIIPVEIMANYLSFGGMELDCAFARDITERKQAEEELREKEGKYRLLFESANDGIFIHDETGFTDCNQKGAEMYGLRKEEIIGRLPDEFAPERQPDGRLSSEVSDEKIRAALSGVPQVFEWQPLRADGSPFDVEVTLSRLELGGKTFLQAIVRDISERKRLEEEILRGQKLEAIGTLAGGIAHDFNNLLQAIFGYISLARMFFDQREKSLAMLEQAENALHQSVSLTTQLLTFSKGGKPVKKQISLLPVIENAAKFALSGSRSGYQLNIDPGLWQVDADGGQLGQVIQNLVLNADHAMPEGGTIVIAAKNVLKPGSKHPQLPRGNYVEISVQDSGIGIPEKYLQKIFDPYFTTKEKGSGLGLATSYSIIRNHGGLIDVTSELGKGTVFFIYLPVIETEKEISDTTTASSAVRKGKILVMDDEELVRNLAGELINALGHEVEMAERGEAAIEKYRAAMESGKPFDIVILDLTVRRGMGGKDTIERLRVFDPSVRAIVSSGYSDDAIVADYEKYGFKARLTKPYKLEGLRAALNVLLGG